MAKSVSRSNAIHRRLDYANLEKSLKPQKYSKVERELYRIKSCYHSSVLANQNFLGRVLTKAERKKIFNEVSGSGMVRHKFIEK